METRNSIEKNYSLCLQRSPFEANEPRLAFSLMLYIETAIDGNCVAGFLCNQTFISLYSYFQNCHWAIYKLKKNESYSEVK